MHVRLQAGFLRLSLQNVSGKRQPVVYDNDTRARIFRAVRPSPKHNEYPWNFKRPNPADVTSSPQERVRGNTIRPEDAPDWDYFAAHSYDDLSHGF